jgi:ribulose-5-phosphate 4-epimerase/fuculose-1-phosphate aldolase
MNAKSGEGNGRSAPIADPTDLQNLVLANRILYKYGVVDGFGHVSLRHPQNPDHFLLSRNLAPARVTPKDIFIHDFFGKIVETTTAKPYLERFLHAEIYKARPEVMAIVHSHANTVIPFGVVKEQPLRPLWHMAGFLKKDVPIFDIRDHAGDGTDLLITDTKLGAALASDMGDASVVLMRGHGATIVGKNLPEVCFRAVYTQLNADIQLKALAVGDITYLSELEAAAAAENIGGQVNRAWNLWCEEVESDFEE